MKNSLSTILCIALALICMFSFVGCNKITTKDIDSEAAYDALMNDETGVVILGRNYMDLSVSYTRKKGNYSENGCATICMDNDYIAPDRMQETPIVHSMKTVVDEGVTTVTEYYAGYIKEYQAYFDYTKKTKLKHLYKITTNGEVATGNDELIEAAGNAIYNELCADCGVYTGRNYIESILEECEPTVTGKQFIQKKKVVYTEIYLSYSYLEDDETITGKATVTISNENKINKISFVESNGMEYSAEYTFNAAHFEMPESI